MSTETILFVCANDVVLNQLGEFIRTLRASDKGAFEGKVVVLTDDIRSDYQEILKTWQCEVFVSKLEWPAQFHKTIDKTVAFECAKKRRNEGRLIDRVYSRIRNSLLSRFSIYSKLHREALYDVASVIYIWRAVLGVKSTNWQRFHQLWCRKHLSKLLMLNYLNTNRVPENSILIMADSDMLLQSNFSTILNKVKSDPVVYVGSEEKDTLSAKVNTSSVYWSNILAYEKDFYEALSFGEDAHEINVGFSIGYSGAMRKVFEGWKALMIKPEYEDLWYCHPWHFWHEQDFFRAYLNLNPQMVSNIGVDSVYHGCGRAAKTLRYDEKTNKYFDSETESVPTIVHFAGSEAKQMASIKKFYSMSYIDYMKKYAAVVADEVSL